MRPDLQLQQINYKMRATMKDGRQLVGQMLAFDKVSNDWVCMRVHDTYIMLAYEPGHGRLRGIPQSKAQGEDRRRSRRINRRADRGDRGEACARPGNHSRTEHRLLLSRRTATSRSERQTRNERSRRNRCTRSDGSRAGYQQAGRPRCRYWSSRTSSRCRRIPGLWRTAWRPWCWSTRLPRQRWWTTRFPSGWVRSATWFCSSTWRSWLPAAVINHHYLVWTSTTIATARRVGDGNSRQTAAQSPHERARPKPAQRNACQWGLERKAFGAEGQGAMYRSASLRGSMGWSQNARAAKGAD